MHHGLVETYGTMSTEVLVLHQPKSDATEMTNISSSVERSIWSDTKFKGIQAGTLSIPI
jgi:hypothetical protein